MTIRTLIIEDDSAYARILERIVQGENMEVTIASTGEQGLQLAEELMPSVVLCDIGLPGIDGIEVVRRLLADDPSITILIVSGQATVENAVAAMRAGAFDILQKTCDPSEIRLRLRRAMDSVSLRRQVEYLHMRNEDNSEIIGESSAMQRVRKRIQDAASSSTATVLIVGDTGTGKELVARAVHQRSVRHPMPLVTINCAAVPENLMESVFFGHEKGAFSGADRTRIGLFETADGSSLFLDEIGELDLRLQAKLLRAIEERTITRVGSTREIKVDIRLIIATNRDLTTEVTEKRFREDLLYRINVFTIQVPSLQERGDDCLLLARYFSLVLSRQLGKRIRMIDPEAERLLGTCHFPGNVRQLRNVIEQAVILAQGDCLGPELFDSIVAKSAPPPFEPNNPANFGPDPDASVEDLSKRFAYMESLRTDINTEQHRILQSVLTDAGGNKTKAAQILRISRFVLQRRLKKFDAETKRP